MITNSSGFNDPHFFSPKLEESIRDSFESEVSACESKITINQAISLTSIQSDLKSIEFKLDSMHRELKSIDAMYWNLQRMHSGFSGINRHDKQSDLTIMDNDLKKLQNHFLSNIKKLETDRENYLKIERFLKITEQRMKHDHCLKLNMKLDPQEIDPKDWNPIFINDDYIHILQDKEWPLDASFARLLLVNPYKRIPYPEFKSLVESNTEARQLRLDVINLVSEYELYFEDRLIFKKSHEKVEIHDEIVFSELCNATSKWPKLIDDSFIENAVNNVYVPKNSRKTLEKYKGLKINEAIENSCAFVNLKNAHHLYQSEVKNLDSKEKYLFKLLCSINKIWSGRSKRSDIDKDTTKLLNALISGQSNETKFSAEKPYFTPAKLIKSAIQYPKTFTIKEISEMEFVIQPKLIKIIEHPFLCPKKISKTETPPSFSPLSDKDLYLDQGIFRDKENNQILGELQHRYKFLNTGSSSSDSRVLLIKNIKNIFQYLSGEAELTSLNLNIETLPEFLRLIKMIELSNSIFNYSNLRKNSFERGSYELRTLILEKRPELTSSDVFSKTLSLNNMITVPNALTAMNLTPERLAVHCKALVDMSTKVTSNTRKMAKLVGARGNSGSGKSTAFMHEKIVLNPDSVKFGLRRGTKIKNYQIHNEGSLLFKKCFEEIERNSTLNYTIDLRMKTLDDIKKYLIYPAIRRNCKVVLSDFEVPLLTSINRMFKRNPTGKEPLQGLDPVLDGFRGIRTHRTAITEYIKNENIIEEYNLYYLGKLIAKKSNGAIIVLDEDSYKKCFEIPTNQEIEEILNTPIDDKYIKDALERNDLRVEESVVLERWIGSTVKQALEAHISSI